MSVHVGYTVTDSTVPHGGSGTPTVRLTQSYTPTKPLQIIAACSIGQPDRAENVRYREHIAEKLRAARGAVGEVVVDD